MKMVTRLALANMKYYKRKNILIGIAIYLTTLLLFLVPTIGYDLIESQHATINELYPSWHVLYRNVTEDTVEKLSVHHYVTRWGLRSDLGYVVDEDADISLLYLDTEGFDLYHMELTKGRLPQAENEIVVSEGLLKEISQAGEIGDTITLSYQVYRDGGLDYIQEKDFVISGFIADTDANAQQKVYFGLISKAFLEQELQIEQIRYRFMFQVFAEDAITTEELENRIYQIAQQFDIHEQNIGINVDYLGANYVDPAYVPAVVIIMLIIVMAGIITIYSIYYVSMGERVQEFGKLKAIGATRKQLRRIVFLEGLTVAGIAIPLGLVTGTILTKSIFFGMFALYHNENEMMNITRELIMNGAVPLWHLWIYLLTIGVAVVTVYLSLMRPTRIISKVSEIEAMRYQDGYRFKKRKGYQNITVGRLTKRYLTVNKKKSAITICSMAITGVFFMIVATVLACADPVEGAYNSILGEYEISPIVEFNNREHPEREWSEVQKNNPLTEELKEQILQIEGIEEIKCFKETFVSADIFEGYRKGVIGIPESEREQLEAGIVEGNVTYEELTKGDKVIIDNNLLYWYPDLKRGDILDVTVEDGKGTHKRQLEIVAVGDYPLSFTNYSYLIMAEEGIEKFSEYNLNFYYHIFAKESYNVEVEAKLNAIVEATEQLELRSWQNEYEEYSSNIAMTSGVCYAFLGILGAICIMNMINTMIHSVHVRKKEIGVLQAVGMSDRQLHNMLQLEGLFYTLGTIVVAVGGGSLAGYPIFLWAKENAILNISNYHYPTQAAIIVVIVLVVVQLILTLALGKSMKKTSLIDRIRFSE